MKRNRFEARTALRLSTLAMLGFFSLIFGVNAYAQQGKITAKILDAKTGEPLLRASIQIVQNRLGAYTKENGIATIINVPPDENYTIVAKYTGYLPDTLYHVKVESDVTTSLNFKLGTKEKVVTVVAQAPLVEKTKTDISTKFQSSTLANIAGRQRLEDVILLTPGVVQDNSNGGFSFHGSRGSANSIRLNGIENSDPLTGQSSALQVGLSRLAVSEVDVVTGSADASKGGFTGGEVNTQTKAGGNDLALSAHYRTEIPSLFGSSDQGVKLMPLGDNIYEFSLGGPLFTQDLKFYITGRLESFTHYSTSNTLSILDPLGNNLGQIPLTNRYYRTGSGKLSFDAFGFSINANVALDAESSLDNGWGTLYEDPYYVPATEWTNNVYSIDGRGQIGDGVLEFTAGYSLNDVQTGKYDQSKPVDAFHLPQFLSVADNYTVNTLDNSITKVPDGIIDIYTPVNRQIPDPGNPSQPYSSQVPGPNPFTGHIEGPSISQSSANAYGIVGLFPVVGNVSGFSIENSGQTQFNGNYTVQIGSHQLEAGFETNIMSVYSYSNQLPWDANPFKDSFLVHPYVGGVFVMDKMEFSDITFHPGLRFDFYQPDANQIPDLYNPLGVGVANYSLKPTKIQTQLSPRLAITYAVTDQTTFNFGYNWYFKNPSLQDVLTNTAGGNIQSLTQVLQRGNQILGQAGLNADRTKEIDVGFNTQLSDIFSFSITGIYKDLRNQTGLELISSPLLPIGYTIYTDDQYGSARSIELVMEKRMSDNYSVKFNYTLGSAKGTSSSATENYAALINQDPNSQQAVLPLTPFPFDYDREHVANLLFNVLYNRDEGPTIFGKKLLQWFSLQTTTVFETGVPYTATDIRGNQIGAHNGEREPDYFQTDATLTRTIPFEDIFGPSMSTVFLDLQLEVLNVFNRNSPLSVYSATGQGNNDGNGNSLLGTVDYYNDPTNTSHPGSIDALGNLYYNSRLDLNHDGRVSGAEQQVAYARFRADNYARETNYQIPRRVFFNVTIRF